MASLIKQHGRYYLQFYDAGRTPKQKRNALGVTIKQDARRLKRKLESLAAEGRYDPWTDDPQEALRRAEGRGRRREAKSEETFKRLRDVVAPLYEVLGEWREYLREEWADENSYYAGNGWHVKNETGVSVSFDDLSRRPDKRAVQLAAFRLQGREAAFIHELTILSKEYGYEVISNEHDGLVTIGEIPEEAVERVRRKRSMTYVRLPEKSFM